jgi:ribosomal protein L37AE/L43A
VGGSLIVAGIASAKGRSGFGWLLLSVLISPLLAGIIVAALPPVPWGFDAAALSAGDITRDLDAMAIAAGDMKQCPECAELVRAEAKICRFCRYDFSDAMSPEALPEPEHPGPTRCPKCDSPQIAVSDVIDTWMCYSCGAKFPAP